MSLPNYEIWCILVYLNVQAASVVPTTRADFRSSRSYYAVLDLASLSASDNGLEHVLTVQNSQGATNYTFRLEVLGQF